MYSELWGKFLSGDTDVINNTTFTEDVVVVTELGDIVGIDAVKEFYLNYLYGFSEIDFKIIDAFGRGNKLIKNITILKVSIQVLLWESQLLAIT